ncbi:hypothetical protein J2W56_004998 [Nocardia kruczakiae]|uniref:Mutator family transposase n=1 Tax=Nocardia kruczakiae TaxID=261477 RepID=A0ABU1XL21_9NOCA|nr:hypothetical protein [Nocardia kruczakiae]
MQLPRDRLGRGSRMPAAGRITHVHMDVRRVGVGCMNKIHKHAITGEQPPASIESAVGRELGVLPQALNVVRRDVTVVRDVDPKSHDSYRATRGIRIAPDVEGRPWTVAVGTDRDDPIALRTLVPIELTLATRLLGTLHLRGQRPRLRVPPFTSRAVRTTGIVSRRRHWALPRIVRRRVIRRGLARPRSRSWRLMIRNRASRRPIHRVMRRRIRMPMGGGPTHIRPALHGRGSLRVRMHRARCRPRMFYRTRWRAVDPRWGRTRSTPVVVVGRARLRCPIIR